MAIQYFQRSTTATNTGTLDGPVLTSRQASTTAGGASADIATGNIAAGATTNVYFFTDDPAPGADGATGDYSVVLRFSTTNAQIQASVALARVNSSGTQQATGSLSTEQVTTGSPLTFGFTGENLGTWAAGDRLRVRVQLRNQHTMNQACTLAVNNGADTIDTPFSAAPTTVQGSAAGAHTYTGTAAGAAGSGGGAVTFVTQANRNGGGSDANVATHTINRPAEVQNGDVAVFFLAIWTSNPAITAPGNAVQRANVANGVCRTFVYLAHVGSETSWTFSWTGANWSTLQAQFFRGVNPSLDLATAPFNSAAASGTSFGATSVSTVANAGLAWGGNTIDYSGTPTHTPPTNFTETLDFFAHTSAYRISPGTGSQSASGATISASETNLAVLVALAPAAGGPTTVNGSASGNYVHTGSGTGQRTVNGSASGTYSHSGTAAGSSGAVEVQGTAAGAYTSAGVADGTASAATVQGSAASAYTYAGTATGSGEAGAAQGTASATYVYAGTATGQVTVTGGATGTYAYVGDGDGTAVVFGSATRAYAYAGSATGTGTTPPLVDLSFIALAPELAHGPALAPELVVRAALAPEASHGLPGAPETAARAVGVPALAHGEPGDPELNHGQPEHDPVHGDAGEPEV